LRFPGERSIGKGRISEILALVNTTEKTTLREFSIRLFVSVFVLGSQTISLRSPPAHLLMLLVCPRLP
jgi:hypothetical protein